MRVRTSSPLERFYPSCRLSECSVNPFRVGATSEQRSLFRLRHLVCAIAGWTQPCFRHAERGRHETVVATVVVLGVGASVRWLGGRFNPFLVPRWRVGGVLLWERSEKGPHFQLPCANRRERAADVRWCD